MKRLAFLLLTLLIAGDLFGQTSVDMTPTEQTGTPVLGSYFATGIDNVSLTNGNLYLSVPVFSIPGRDLGLHLSLDYNSRAFDKTLVLDDDGDWIPQYTFNGWQTNTGLGGSLTAAVTRGGLVPGEGWYYWQLDVYWVESNGTKHHFQEQEVGSWYATDALLDNQTIQSTDSEFLTINTGTYFDSAGGGNATMWFKNGTSIYFEQNVTGGSPAVPRWTMTTPNGNQFVVGDGTPTSYLPSTDTLGRSISYSYNGSTMTSTMAFTDANGSAQDYQWQYTTVSNIAQPETPWESPGYPYVTLDINVVSAVTLPNGKSYQLTYDDTTGLLSKVTFPSGGYIRYTWDRAFASHVWGPWEVTSRIVSPDGTSGSEQTWTYSYNYTEWVGPSPLGLAWPGLNQGDIATTTVTDPTGAQVIHYFTNDIETETQYLTSTGAVLRTVFNNWQNLSSNPSIQSVQVRTDFATTSNSTAYTYDSYNNVTGETYTDYNGSTLGSKTRTFTTIGANLGVLTNETLLNPDSSVASKTDFAYDQYSLTTRSSMPDHNGNTSATGRANLTTIMRYKDSSCSTSNLTHCVTTHMKYDNAGNTVEKGDALGNATLIDFTDNYSDSTNHYSFAFPTKVTNALSQYTTSEYNYNAGLPIQTTDLRGNANTTVYDVMNRVTSITEPKAVSTDSTGKVTSYSYDDTDLITTKQVTVDSSNVGQVKSYFDGLYRVIHKKTNDPDGEIEVDTVYDALGRANKVSNPYRDSGSASAWTYTSYDAIGRTVCTSVSTATTSPCASGGPAGATTLSAYATNVTTTTNAAGNQRRYTYNALGKLVKVEEPNPTLDTPLVTTYTYAIDGTLSQTGQSGQTRTLTHDWLGRETQEVLPESGTTTYVYDDAGHMTSATDARGVATYYGYDALGRATGRSYSDSTPAVSFSYDASGYTGFRTFMYDSLGYVGYSYDNAGRLTQEQRTFDSTKSGVSGTYSTSYAYNIKGDLTQMTYPSGRVVNFNYKTGGGCCNSKLDSVGDATTGVTAASGMSYSAAGNITARTLNPGGSIPLVEAFSYNEHLQTTEIQASESSVNVMDISYNYGTTTNVGQLLSRTDAVQPEHSVNYGYDSIYRLSQVASADGSWGISWTFDAWGNRLTQTPSGFAYTASLVGTQTLGYTNNRLTTETYDSAGNVTNDGVHSYAYNGKNQIASMDSGAATYMYDGEGRRAKKTVSSVSTFYFYGPGNSIISEFSTDTSISSASAASSSDKTCYQTSDGQETAVLLIDGTGRVVENNRTLPYGELWSPSVQSINSTKYTTYERDQESNLDYAMNRYMANTYGRFMSSDKGPIRQKEPTSMNRYLYTSDNPVNGVDPTGAYANNGVICDASYQSSSDCDDSNDDCPGLQGSALLDARGCDPSFDVGGPPPAPEILSCEEQETDWLMNYLDAEHSPLAAYAQTIVTQSDQAGIDDRFIVALAGQESSWGTKITRGPFNAWNNLAHTANHNPYTSWNSAISGVINLLTGKLYINGKPPLKSVAAIYGLYDESDPEKNPHFSKQLAGLTNIYMKMTGGPGPAPNSQNVNISRCAPGT